MPVTYDFEMPATFAVRASGNVTYGEVKAAIDRIAADPRLTPGTVMLTETRDVIAAPSAMELRAIAGDLRALHQRGMVAFATLVHNDFLFGIGRMIGTFANAVGVNADTFRHESTARAWLAAVTESDSQADFR